MRKLVVRTLNTRSRRVTRLLAFALVALQAYLPAYRAIHEAPHRSHAAGLATVWLSAAA